MRAFGACPVKDGEASLMHPATENNGTQLKQEAGTTVSLSPANSARRMSSKSFSIRLTGAHSCSSPGPILQTEVVLSNRSSSNRGQSSLLQDLVQRVEIFLWQHTFRHKLAELAEAR